MLILFGNSDDVILFPNSDRGSFSTGSLSTSWPFSLSVSGTSFRDSSIQNYNITSHVNKLLKLLNQCLISPQQLISPLLVH